MALALEMPTNLSAFVAQYMTLYEAGKKQSLFFHILKNCLSWTLFWFLQTDKTLVLGVIRYL